MKALFVFMLALAPLTASAYTTDGATYLCSDGTTGTGNGTCPAAGVACDFTAIDACGAGNYTIFCESPACLQAATPAVPELTAGPPSQGTVYAGCADGRRPLVYQTELENELALVCPSGEAPILIQDAAPVQERRR